MPARGSGLTLSLLTHARIAVLLRIAELSRNQKFVTFSQIGEDLMSMKASVGDMWIGGYMAPSIL
jgi:hypothetical protein